MKKKEFYIDVDKAVRLGIIGRLSVTLNGKRIGKILAAKSGKNGLVEYYEQDPKIIDGDRLESKKLRGVVKISIRKEFKIEEDAPCPFGCMGQKLQYKNLDDCSCHLFAPCFNCESSILECVECGYEKIQY